MGGFAFTTPNNNHFDFNCTQPDLIKNLLKLCNFKIFTVTGVVEILNKKGDERFDRNDESLFEVSYQSPLGSPSASRGNALPS